MKGNMGVFLVLALCLAAWCSLPAEAGWRYVTLHPTNASSSSALDVQNGTAVGAAYFSYDSHNAHAVCWSDPTFACNDIHPSWAIYSEAQGIGHQIVGMGRYRYWDHACVWTGPQYTCVDLNPDGSTESYAFDVDEDRQVGYAMIGSQWCAGWWIGYNQSWQNLNPSGATQSKAMGIHGSQQVGFAVIDGIHCAGLWTDMSSTWVSLHPSGCSISEAYDTNGTQQVGYAYIGSSTQASLWSGTVVSRVDLTPSPGVSSRAYAISGDWQAGYASITALSQACVWRGTAASWFDLHSVLPAGVYSTSMAFGIDATKTEVWVCGRAGNQSTGHTEAMLWHYSPISVIGITGKAARDPIMDRAKRWYDFAVWGRVTKQDNDTFTVNDGSGPVKVIAAGHGLSTSDYARAAGSLDNTTSPPTLTSSASRVRKLN